MLPHHAVDESSDKGSLGVRNKDELWVHNPYSSFSFFVLMSSSTSPL